jgi:hypothetical protein
MTFIHGAFTGILVNLFSCAIVTLLMRVIAIGDKNLFIWFISISLPWFLLSYGFMYMRLETNSFSLSSFRVETTLFSFILLLFTSTVGTLIVESLQRGADTISIGDYLKSGLLYSLLCLPVLSIFNYYLLKRQVALTR